MLRRTLFAFALVVIAVAMPPVVTDVIDTSFYIVDETTPGPEDAYVLADIGRIEGVLEGDLMIAVYEDLTISGTVQGDVVVAAGGSVVVTETGSVEGSLRGVARRVVIDGSVRDDAAIAAISTDVSGTIGRDLVGAGGSFDVDGEVGRNIQGWFVSGRIDAAVGNDIDVRVRALHVGSSTAVAGDLLYRADTDASVASGASVAGSLSRLSTRAPFVVRVSLALFTILGLISFTILGLFVLWGSRSLAPRAAGSVVTRPGRVVLVGLAAVLGVPVIGAIAVALISPFLAKVAVVALFLVVAIIAVLFGPIPALTAIGDRITRGRAGLFGGFVIGVVLWRLSVWLVPILGLFVSLSVLVVGVGGWLTAWWDRRASDPAIALMAGRRSAAVSTAEADGHWEPPLPPLPTKATTDGPYPGDTTGSEG